MKTRYLIAALAALFPGIGLAAAAEREDPAYGYWLTENRRAIIEIGPCKSSACGKIIWSAAPRDPSGAPKRDVHNSDPALRARTICGLDLIGGFASDGRGQWQDGWIYNPRDGETYSANLEAQSDGTLKVRGYLGFELLGKSQIWTRVGDDRGGC